MRIPLDQFVKAFSARRQAAEAGAGEVRLAVMVAEDAGAAFARAVRAALRPQTAGARLYVAGFGARRGTPAVNCLADAAAVLAGSDGARAAALARAYAAAGVPCCVLVPAEAGPDVLATLLGAADDGAAVLVCDAAGAPRALGDWLVAALPDAGGALAAGFPCCRAARGRALAREAARGNALIAALPLFDGADLPAMLAAEVAMMLKMADAYGLPLDWSRLGEGAAIAAASFALRGCSRAACRALPLPAPLVRAGVAAAGTYALGRALMASFEARAAWRDAGSLPVVPLTVETVGVEGEVSRP